MNLVFAVAVSLIYFVARTLVIAGGATLYLQRSAFAAGRRVYRRAFGEGQLKSEVKAAIGVIAFDAVALGLSQAEGVIHYVPPTLANVAFSFALFFVWFEIWFYVTHRVLHTRALYWIHAQHHVAKVTHPISSLSFGLLERAILIGGAIGGAVLASRVVPISLPGVGLYFLLNYVLNVFGHLNVELFRPGYAHSGPGKIFYSVTFHAMHHARYSGHYGLFTPLLDRAFGSAFADYPEVQTRAARGQGLEAFGQRVSA